MKIAIVGYGQMGHMIHSCAEAAGHQVVITADPMAKDASFTFTAGDSASLAAAIKESGAVSGVLADSGDVFAPWKATGEINWGTGSYGMWQRWGYNAKRRGEDKYNPVAYKASQVKSPSHKIRFMESYYYTPFGFDTYWNTSAALKCIVWNDRHGNRNACNSLMADGHVEVVQYVPSTAKIGDKSVESYYTIPLN